MENEPKNLKELFDSIALEERLTVIQSLKELYKEHFSQLVYNENPMLKLIKKHDDK